MIEATRATRASYANLLGGVCSTAIFVACLPASAWAQAATASDAGQTAPAPEQAATDSQQGDIIVTGIRAGLRNAIEVKRKEMSIVEAVTAEDIGKLPDQSIAESIARLPGIAAQRLDGRAQVISVRGLPPDFTTTHLNGRPQASSGDNRAVEFDQYPSELLNAVVVYKTPDANVADFGLAGTADLRTVRPLAFGKNVAALNFRGELLSGGKLNSDVSNKGYRATASYIGKLTPEFGIAFGLTLQDSPEQNLHYKAYNYETFCYNGESWCTFLRDRISPDSADRATFLTGQEIFAYSRRNKRLAGIFIAEWEPSDRIHSTLDLYYSKFQQRTTMRGAQWFSNLWADDQTFTNVVTQDIGGTQVAVSGTANRVAPQLRSDYNKRDDRLFSAGLNNEFELTDRLSLITDLSYSSNKRDESISETYMGYGCCANAATQNANRVFDSISWDISGNGFPTYSEGLDYADANNVSLGDRAPWGGWGHDGATKEPHVKENVFSLDGGLRYEFDNGFLEQVDVGVNYTGRDKKKRVDEWDLMLKNGRAQVLVADDLLIDPTSLDYAGFGHVLSYDTAEAIKRYYDRVVLEDANHFDKAWKINEDVTTLKARAVFSTGNLHGNIGIQVVHAKQRSIGQRINVTQSPISITEVDVSKSYTDVLPSLNAYYDLGGGHRIRFAAAKVLARPRMDEMRANLTPGFSNPCSGGTPCQPGQTIHPWSASGGNPELEPWRAKAVDLNYEWYIDKGSYLSVALFYKKLDNYIYKQLLPYDFSGLPLPSTASTIPPGVIISPIGTISQPANGKGGWIKGVEFSGALEFGQIAPILEGFGVIGNLSITDSNLKTKNPGDGATSQPDARLPGLSKYVYSITGYYEKNGFQARLAYRHRSGFKGEVPQLFATRGLTEILTDKQLDAQIGYTFPETSPLHDFGVQLQLLNVTNSPYRTRLGLDGGGASTADGGKLLETYEKYGRHWLLGFSYKF